MTKLEKRLRAHRRRKKRIMLLKKILRKTVMVFVALIMIPAYVVYAVNMTGSLAFFTKKIEKDFRIYKPRLMSFLNTGESTPLHVDLTIVGEESLPVPATTQYSAVLYADGVQVREFWHVWSLAEAVDDVIIEPATGVLVVGENATAEAITICLDIAGFSATKTITLVYPEVEEELEEEEEPIEENEEETNPEETDETSEHETEDEEDNVPVPEQPGNNPVENEVGDEDGVEPGGEEQGDVPGLDDNQSPDPGLGESGNENENDPDDNGPSVPADPSETVDVSAGSGSGESDTNKSTEDNSESAGNGDNNTVPAIPGQDEQNVSKEEEEGGDGRHDEDIAVGTEDNDGNDADNESV